jgi:hypothetical protein
MRNLKPFLLVLGTLLLSNACSPDELTPTTHETIANARKGNKELSRKEIDAFIEEALAKKSGGGLTRPIYHWGEDFVLRRICGSNCEDDLLDYLQAIWSTTKYTGPVITVGYQMPASSQDGLVKPNPTAPGLQQVRQQVLDIAFSIEKAYNKGLTAPEDLVVSSNAEQASFDIRITQLETFQKLTNSGFIRYFDCQYQPKSAQKANGNTDDKK